MPFSFKITGLEETLAKLRGMGDDIKQAVDDELTATSYEIADEAKMLVPVDLGALKNSINVTRDEPLLKQVSATANYAAYVEFGTGTNVRIENAPIGLQEYAIQFKGQGKEGKHPVKIKGQWRMVPYQLNLRARPYFFPAYQAKTHDLVQRLKRIIEEEGKL